MNRVAVLPLTDEQRTTLERWVRADTTRRCCMKALRGWGGVARTSLDPPQEPHYWDAVEGSSPVQAKYRVANWPAYNQALVRRGDVTGRCCTNRDWPARCPPTGSSPADAIRHWSAEGGHPIQDLTAENGLTRPCPAGLRREGYRR